MAQAATDHSRSAQVAQAFTGDPQTALQPAVAPALPSAPVAPPAQVASAAATARFGATLDRTRELDCLAKAVYFEARGETPRGQAAVAQVVLNRVKHPAFPNTVCGVVFQGAARHGCQFSFACDGSMRRHLEPGAWNRARKVAARALSGFVLADVGKATHFHTTGVSPGWGSRMLRVSQVGLHVFYRFNPHPRSVVPTPQHAVFVSLPAEVMAPTAPLRIATAMVEKTIDATLTTPAQLPHSPPPAATQQTAQRTAPLPVSPGSARPVKAGAGETPSSGVIKASDIAAVARAAPDEPADS